MTPEIQSKMQIWRRKALDGTLTEAEMTEAIQVLREGRVGAQAASDASRRKKAIAAVPNADDLLGELGGL